MIKDALIDDQGATGKHSYLTDAGANEELLSFLKA
jgi:hypothetical protein